MTPVLFYLGILSYLTFMFLCFRFIRVIDLDEISNMLSSNYVFRSGREVEERRKIKTDERYQRDQRRHREGMFI